MMEQPTENGAPTPDSRAMTTCIVPCREDNLKNILPPAQESKSLHDWQARSTLKSKSSSAILDAAHELRTTNVPVAFPTETVYGLGADATNSEAVRNIFAAKGRPADNPLIVHVATTVQLRHILQPTAMTGSSPNSIPPIYEPLMSRFWPGPLTLIMPLPQGSTLAPEVTAGLSTFGVRIPSSAIALDLLVVTGRPIAAPSANASGRPSPTCAEHVYEDLNGRIRTILDGGPCSVGVESTVVDGLCDPPVILRPGGIGIDRIRECPGWENVRIAYQDQSQASGAPRAPGMKYRHYAPKAQVVLFEHGHNIDFSREFAQVTPGTTLGIIRSSQWKYQGEPASDETDKQEATNGESRPTIDGLREGQPEYEHALLRFRPYKLPPISRYDVHVPSGGHITAYDIMIGPETEDIARGLFSALRELDRKGVDRILVEGINDTEGTVATAVMNRIRKAAEVHVDSNGEVAPGVA